MRAPLESQIARADALLLIGDGDKAAPLVTAFEAQGKPVLKARMATRGDSRWLGVLPVIGFAGIANPEEILFVATAHGARLIDTRPLPTITAISERQAAFLLKWAREQNAMLVTTEKDWVRLPEDDGTALGELKHRSRPLPIAIEFADADALKELLVAALEEAAKQTCPKRGLRVGLAEALERRRGVDIGLLQLDAPIAQLVERDGAPGDGAAHEVAGRQHLHLAVEIFEPGLALEAEIAFESVHHSREVRIISVAFASP